MHAQSNGSKRLHASDVQHRSIRVLPQKLAGTYFIVAVLWIALSHFWLDTVVPVSTLLSSLQSIEDLLFAGLTAWMIYWLLQRTLHHLARAEAELRESEERLRLILQNMPVMLDAFDDRGGIVTWNQECERVTGYSAAEIIGNPQAMTLLYPEATYRQKMVETWVEWGNDYRDWEWEMTCRDGSVKTVAWSNIADQVPIPGWKNWSIGVDVTDRKRSEAALRESEARFRLMTETIQDVFWLCSADKTQILYVSPAYEQVWGRSCASVCENPRSLLETVHPDDQIRVGDWLAHTNESKTPFEYRIVKPDGSIRWIAHRFFLGNNAVGHVHQTVGISRDITDHKEAEIALRENEEFFKLSLDFTHIGSWEWRVPVNQVIWNDNHARLLGLVPGEVQVSYQAWRDRVHPDDIDRVEQAVTQALVTKTNFEAEYRVIHPDGSLHWLIGRGRGIYDAADQVIRMIGVIVDITDRKHTEESLRESETLFRSLCDSSPVGIYLTRADGYTTYTNPRCQEIFGFTLLELLGYGWGERLHPDDREQVLQGWTEARAKGQSFITDYRIVTPQKNLRWVQTHAAVIRSDTGELNGYVGTIEDITDRKRSEQQIHTLNQTLEGQNLKLEALVEQRTAELMTFINTLPDYIFVVERDTMRMAFCNELVAKLIGWESRHEVAGKTIFECYTPELAATFATQNQHVFDTGETLHFQETYTTPLGTLNFDTYKIPLKKPNGEVYALIGTSRDISELVKARQTLADRTVQLEAANREMESFSYSVSHDLRAPLRHLTGFVGALTDQLTQNGHLTDPKVIHYLQILQNSSQTMGQLIDGLLTLSRVGRRQKAHIPVDLNQVVAAVLAQRPENTVSDASLSLSDNGRPVQFCVSELPLVMGDATLLQQVFANLIDNAVKFSRVRETSAKQHCDPAQIEIGSLSDGIIFVRDHGVGFQMEYADQLFGAFQRLHSRSEFEGNGIGLAIVQRIIHRHGGKIWAESQPNEGTTFYFQLGGTTELRAPGYSSSTTPQPD